MGLADTLAIDAVDQDEARNAALDGGAPSGGSLAAALAQQPPPVEPPPAPPPTTAPILRTPLTPVAITSGTRPPAASLDAPFLPPGLRSFGAPSIQGAPAPTQASPAPLQADPNPFAASGAGDAQTLRTPAMVLPTVDPSQRAALAGANEEKQEALLQERAANDATSEAGVAGNQAGAEGSEKLAAMKTSQAQESLAAAAKDRAEAEDHYREIRAAREQWAQERIDPNRLWNNMSTGQKVMSKLAQSLGAAGAVLGHSQNFALESLNRDIANDVQAQKENHENGYRSIEGQESAYERFRAQGLSVKDAEAKANGALLDAVKDANAAAVQRTQDPAIRAQGIANDAKIKGMIADTKTAGAKEQIATSRYLPPSATTVLNLGGRPVAMTPAVTAAKAKWDADHAGQTQALDRVEARLRALKPGEDVAGIYDRAAPNRLKDPEAKSLDADLMELIAKRRKAAELPNRGGGPKEDLDALTNGRDIATFVAKERQRLRAEQMGDIIHAATTGKVPQRAPVAPEEPAEEGK